EDELVDLREANGGSNGEDIAEFSDAFEKVQKDWEKFHDDYAKLRDDRENLDQGEVSAQLSALADQIGEVVTAIGELPSGDATDKIAESLKEAAEAEAAAVQELSEAYQTLPDEPAEPADPDATTTNGSSNGGVDPALFDAVDEKVEDSNKALEEAQEDLKASAGEVSPEDLAALNEFQAASDKLIQDWDSFHRDYDAWQQDGRGCDETAATKSLGEFAVRSSELANQVRGLPQSDFLSTIGDALVEAAEREEESYRVLRNNWRPFGTDVYRGVEQERTNAQQLRRQASQGMQQLMERFGISAGDI
ncbi:MAG: hypothetical protein ACE5Q6_23160, partial [Dehalococcoidia bacterium]